MCMIERLHGILVERHPTFAVIECGGVGYGVQISARTGERLPAEGSEITLLTHLVVREDAMELFGFADAQEKELFLSMITVNGVGPKTAQRILSSVSPGDFLSIIARGDKAALGKIKGVGKKTAEMFVLNLFHRYKKSVCFFSCKCNEKKKAGQTFCQLSFLFSNWHLLAHS